MQLSYRCYATDDKELLVEWLTSQEWPFHVRSNPIEADVQRWLRTGTFDGEDVQTFWIELNGEPVGLMRAADLLNEPTLDLRVKADHREKGIGKLALTWLTARIFEQCGEAERISAQVRADNAAMCSVLHSVGYVKIVHSVNSWPASTRDRLLDSFVYEMLRDDWLFANENGHSSFRTSLLSVA
ncbi:MAG: GNAT family N-acetyltransferase [Candidatus Obscuribacterales bacterium]|nr:GNAT family N-acetyltransferase [Candidatus Obscuribacterales bacterium]